MNKFPWFQSTDDKTFLSYDPVKEKRKDLLVAVALVIIFVPFVLSLTA